MTKKIGTSLMDVPIKNLNVKIHLFVFVGKNVYFWTFKGHLILTKSTTKFYLNANFNEK